MGAVKVGGQDLDEYLQWPVQVAGETPEVRKLHFSIRKNSRYPNAIH